MRSVRIHAFGEPPRVEELPDPEPREGHTIVRVGAATVGHVDRTIWSGGFLRHPPLPYTPGVEAAGVVVAGGPFPAGTRVWVRGGGLGTATDGTWAELVAAPDASIGEVPDGVPDPVASAFFSPSTSAWCALREVGRLDAGETVLVTGATGAVGSMTVRLALDAGARVLAAVARPEALDDLPGDALGFVVEAGPPEGAEVDLLVDTVGGPVLEALLPAVRPGGRAVVLGYTAGKDLTLDLPAFIQRDVQLLPLNMIRRESAGRAAAPELLARFADGRLHLPVTTFAFEEAADALAWLARRGTVGRAVLVPTPGPQGTSPLPHEEVHR